jgi:TrmH family RNA methyltransferase
VVGVVRWRAAPLAARAFAADRPLMLVEGVEKPGNLGAILRTVDAAGLAGVIVCDGRTDPANPAVIRASLGTAFAVPLAVATAGEAIVWCGEQGRRVVAATPAGDRPWHAANLRGNAAILLGSEAHGITPAWREAAADGRVSFETVRLPMRGVADSLNLSATAAVLAYESVRQMECRP